MERKETIGGLLAAVLGFAIVYLGARWAFSVRFPDERALVTFVGVPVATTVGVATGLLAAHVLGGRNGPHAPRRPLPASTIALFGGAIGYLVVGGLVGLDLDGPGAESWAVGTGLVGGGIGAFVVYGFVTRVAHAPSARERWQTVISALGALLVGILVTGIVFVATTELLDPHIWPATMFTAPLAVVVGLVVIVVSFGRLRRRAA
ncbi:hypothetical protein [Haladaptatus sp. NG-WS-4]